MAAAAVIAFVLGFIWFYGADVDNRGPLDSLYLTIQLFVLESGNVDTDPSPPLEIARILAPVATVLTTLLALAALFRDELRLALHRRFTRDHVVVAGTGTIGSRLARRLEADGRRVICIGLDDRGEGVRACRASGVAVQIGDATEARALHGARIERAAHLVVACGDDATNVRVGGRALDLSQTRTRPLSVQLHLEDMRLVQLIAAHRLTSGDSASSAWIEGFNVCDVGARLLLEEHPPFAPGAEVPPRLALVGLAGVGEALVLHAVRRWRNTGRPGRVRIVVVGPRAGEELSALLEGHPGLADLCEPTARTLSLESLDGESIDRAAADDGTVYVCTPTPAMSLAAGIAVAGWGDRGARRVVIALDDDDDALRRMVRAVEPRDRRLHVFGVLDRVLGPGLLERGTRELLARALHEQYVDTQRALGVTPTDNPSLVPWRDLPEALRDSNRRFVHGVAAKLEALERVVVPDPLAQRSIDLGLDEDGVEDLARLEHDRWCDDLRRDGWHHWNGPKDPIGKRHPLLVPWDQLSEPDREKDRDTVRALPGMLAGAGFSVARAYPRDSEPPRSVASMSEECV